MTIDSVGSFTARGAEDYNQFRPTLASLENGSFAVAWGREIFADNDILGEIFTSGVNSTGSFTVRGTGDNTQRDATITGFDNGNFAVAWEDIQVPDIIQGEVFTSG